MKDWLFAQDPEKLFRLIDAMPLCIAYIDNEYVYRYANQCYQLWFDLSPEQIIGRKLIDVIGTESFAKVKHHLEQALSGQELSYQAKLPYQFGGTRDVAVQIIPAINRQAQIDGCYAVIQDISSQLETERQLRLNEQRWRLALESSGDGVWDWYPQTGVEILSDRLKEIYGFKADEIADMSEELDRRTHPEDLKQMEYDRQAHFDGYTPIYMNEHRVLCKNGEWKWILTRGTVIERDADGKPLRVIGTHTDISDRKRAEAAVIESESRLRMALSATHQGLYDVDVRTGKAIVNPEYTEMLGYQYANFEESVAAWFKRIHPDDLELVKQAYRDYIANKKEEFRAEFRQKKANGDWCWTLSVGSIVERDKDGQPVRFLGTVLDISERKNNETIIWQQANIDTLTLLPNRRLFYDRLNQDLRTARRTHSILAVLFIDLDFFKEVNDTLGHAIGDALLIEAAQRIRGSVRAADTVARLGGDEFTVSMPNQSDACTVEKVAAKIIQKLSEPFLLANQEVYLSASIGITLYPRDADNLEDLIKHADQAMYAAKNSGRNRFSHFNPGLQTAALNRMRITNELRSAIAEKKLALHFQPIIRLSDGVIRKAEALIRWPDEKGGYISPAVFIPIAETSGLIHAIGEWVFEQATYWVKRWRNLHLPEFQISINQSPIEFQADISRYQNWIQRMRDLELPGQAITIEITEGMLLDTNPQVSQKLLQFRDAGMHVALDDFGTGYSSLSYLQKFDIDYLKIDRSFIRDLSQNSNDTALTEAIIMMAHKLGLKVVAEGVETQAQADILKAAACDYAQGYLFAKPLPPREFEAYLFLARQKQNRAEKSPE